MRRPLLALATLLTIAVLPAAAQGRGKGHGNAGGNPKKEFTVTQNRAMMVTRDVLVHQGFELVRVENVGNDRIVYYRRGNMGNGKGHGPPMKLVIRRTGDRVMFVDVPNAILVDINVKLSS